MEIERNALNNEGEGLLSSDLDDAFTVDPFLLTANSTESSFQSIDSNNNLETSPFFSLEDNPFLEQSSTNTNLFAASTGAEEITVNPLAAGDTFQVTSIVANSDGFAVSFNQNLDTSKLNLYDGLDSSLDLPDVIVTGNSSGTVTGSVVWDEATKTLNFIKTGGVLIPDAYTVNLAARADGLVDVDGNILADTDGTADGFYTVQFAPEPTDAIDTRILSLGDIVRGPAQKLLDTEFSAGLPIKIDEALGVDRISFTINYNSELLLITKASLGANLPADWTITTDLSQTGTAIIELSGSALTETGSLELVVLQTVVPGTATIGSSQILSLDNLSLNGGTVGAKVDRALQQVAYFGDASGNGEYTSLDASLAARVADAIDTGFDFYANTDPNLIADIIKTAGGVNIEDALALARKAVGLTENSIPNLPDNLTPSSIKTVSPTDGTTMVNLTREAVIRFSEPIDPSSVTPDSIKVISSGQEILGRLVVSSTGTFVTFFPDTPWTQSSEVEIDVDGTKILGIDGQPLDADGDGKFGGTIETSFSTLPLTQIPGTRLFGYVYDSYNTNPDGSNRPVVGATIALDALPNIKAVTDANGYFEFTQDLPAPEFAVHIDGGTATNAPEGTLYATVGKLFHSVPGQKIQLSMDGKPFDIYLPPMAASDIQTLSTTENTEVGFGSASKEQLKKILPNVDPSLFDLVKVTFPPGSAQDEEGNDANQATIIPVSPNRLPAPLPPGQEPELVISVQAGINGSFSQTERGATNFDVPAPIEFPNLEGLLPGQKSLIWSFDHDAGAWTIVGTGTVTPDGKSIKSDEGVGVLAPGWHFTNPGNPTDGPPDPPPCLDRQKIVDSVVDVMSTVGDCAKEIAGVGKVINAIFEAAKGVRNLVNNATSLYDQIQAAKAKGEVLTVGTVTAGIKLLNDAKLNTVSVVDSLKSQNPIGKALAIAKCVESALSTFENICGRLTSDPKSPCNTLTVRTVCLGLATARTTLAKVNGLIGKAEEGIKALGLELVCRTIDQLNTIISTGSQVNGQSLEGDLAGLLAGLSADDPVPDEALSLLEDILSQANDVSTTLKPVEDFGTSFEELSDEVDNTAVNGGLIYGEIGGTPANAFYSIEYSGFEFRGKTNAQGKINTVLPPDTDFTLRVYDVVGDVIGTYSGKTGASGEAVKLPILTYSSAKNFTDTDGEGLVDVAETIIGTNASKTDTDGDGLNDLAEVKQGLDATGGQGFPTGIISSLPLQGSAESVVVTGSSVSATQQTAYIATGTYGLAIVNASQFNSPIIQGQLDLVGSNASDVGVDANLQIAAVATNSDGLQLVDVADSMSPTVRQVVDIDAGQVVVADGIAYASVGNSLRVIDLLSGEELQNLTIPGSGTITDLALDRTNLYAFTSGSDTLTTIDISNEGAATVRGQLNVSIASSEVGITAGNGVVYLAGSGITTVNVSNPAAPVLISGADQFFTAREITLNGSGIGLVAAESQGLGVYNISDPSDTDAILTQIDTSGSSNDVAIASGIAYVADGTSGLQVINYLPFDNRGVAPTISIAGNVTDLDGAAAGIQVQEGTDIPLGVNVSDDVQVRNVELLVDGQVVANDVSFPFDFTAIAPNIIAGANTVSIQVRATDTGGNSSLSNTLTYNLVEDTFAPQVVSSLPATGGRQRLIDSIAIRFNEAIDLNSLNLSGMTLTNLGGNGVIGGGDDTSVRISSFQTRNFDRTLVLIPPSNLVPANYQLRLDPSIIGDRAGNSLTQPFTLDFTKRPESVPYNIGDTVTGSIVVAGEDEIYSFNGNVGQKIFFDGISGDNNNLYARLVSPSGNNIFSFQRPADDRNIFTLAETGTYRLILNTNDNTTGNFSYRLLDVNKASDLPLDTQVDGSFNPGKETDIFKFTGTTGQRLYFDSLASLTNATWYLYGPDNSFTSGANLNGDFEATLPRNGVYTLILQDYDDNTNNYSIRVITPETTRTELTLGSTVQGNLTEKGEQDIYTFTGTVGQRLYFDNLDDSFSVSVTLRSPNNENFKFFNTNSNSQTFTLSVGGTYELVVDASGETVGDYNFRLADLSQATDLTFDTQINNTLTPGRETDLYKFTGTVGQKIYFDSLATVSSSAWYLYAPNDQYITGASLSGDFSTTLTQAGTYILAVEGFSDNPINYSIQTTKPTTTTTALTLGTGVSSSIAAKGEQDIYTFTGAVGQRLYFDSLQNSFSSSVVLRDPTGDNIVTVNTSSDRGVFTLTEAGTYQLTIDPSNDTTGNYNFRLLDVSSQPNLAIGTPTVSTLNPVLEADIYQFTATAGQKISIDDLGSNSGASWSIYAPDNRFILSRSLFNNSDFDVFLDSAGTYLFVLDGNSTNVVNYNFQANNTSDAAVTPSGFGTVNSGTIAAGETKTFTYAAPAGLKVLFDSLDNDQDSINIELRDPTNQAVLNQNASSDSNQFILTKGGNYTLTVKGSTATATGDFSFRFLDLAANSTALTLGSVTSGDVPANSQRVYRFNGTIGQKLYYDTTSDASSRPFFNLISPTSQSIDGFGNFSDNFLPVLSQTGTYYLLLNNDTAQATPFNFRLLDLASSSDLAFDTKVDGTLNPGKEVDAYKFAGTVGQKLYFDSLANATGAVWYLYDENNTFVAGTSLGSDFEYTIPKAGVYNLLVDGSSTNTVTYSFQVNTPTVTTNPLTLGTAVTGGIGEAGEEDVYTFTGTIGQRLYFDSLDDAFSTTIQLIDPTDDNIRNFNSSFDTDPFILTESGTYKVIVNPSGNGTGNYNFRLLDLATATNLTFDTKVDATLNPGREVDLYQFAATAGQRLYFDSLTNNFGGTWYLYDSNNRYINGGSIGNDFNTLIDKTGTYTLIFGGNSNNANNLTYSFQVIPSTTNTNSLVLGSTVTGNLTKPGQQDIYTFTGVPGQQVYFDGLAGNANVQLISPSGLSLFFASGISFDREPETLLESGTYQLIVNPNFFDEQGEYRFRLLNIGSQPLRSFGTPITGSIDPTFETDIFRFNGTAGQRISFDDLGSNFGASWSIYAPGDRYIFGGSIGFDSSEFTLSATGVYSFLIQGFGNNNLNYNFRLLGIA
jgi:hypothetical protein